MKSSRVIVVLTTALVTLLLPQAAAGAEVPTNDEIVGAMTVSPLPFSSTQDMTLATSSVTDPVDCGWNVGASLWFVFTAPTQGTVRFTSGASTPDYGVHTHLTVLQGDPGNLITVGCHTHEQNEFVGTRAEVAVTAGQTIYVMASVPFLPADMPTTHYFTARYLSPAPAVHLSLDPKGTVSRSGVARVEGTVHCDYATTARLTVDLSQAFARSIARGGITMTVTCTPQGNPWVASVLSSTAVRFGAGTAALTGQAVASGDFGSTTSDAAQTVRLRAAR